jgi:hypothetical protein
MHNFGWGASEYAVLMLASSVVANLCISSLPALERAFGVYKTPTCTAAVCCVSGGLAFALSARGGGVIAVHVLAGTAFISGVTLLEPSLKALASLYLPPSHGGRSFGVLAMLAGAGEMFGNWAGTALYETAVAPGYTGIGRGGLLPFLMTSALLAASVLALCLVSARYRLPLPRKLSGSSTSLGGGGASRASAGAGAGAGGGASEDLELELTSLLVDAGYDSDSSVRSRAVAVGTPRPFQ